MISIDFLTGFIEGSEWCPRSQAYTIFRDMASAVFGEPDLSQRPKPGSNLRENFGPGVDIHTSGSELEGEHYVVITGDGWRRVPGAQWWEFVETSVAVGLRATRLDVALDDRKPEITVQVLWEVYAEPRLFSGPKKRRQQHGDGDGLQDGRTVYFGSTGEDSLSFLRVYDKAAKEDTSEPWVRWELQTRSLKAQDLWKRLGACQGMEKALQFAGGCIFGFINFWDDATADHLSRRLEPIWWKRLRGCLQCRKARGAGG